MSLQKRGYSVLVVSSSEKFNDSLDEMISGGSYSPVKYVSNISAAKRAFSERSFDLVVINSPLPDDAGLRFSIDICSETESVALFIVKSEIKSEVTERVTPYGVFTLAKPFSRATMENALSWMEASRERLRRAEKRNVSLEEKMEEIRLVNRAKWILINDLKMDEPGAHRFIEKQAMDRCITRKEVAENIIKTYT